MAGIKETKEVVKLGIGIGDALKGAMSDGKLGLDDVMYLVPLATLVGPAVDNIKAVPSELADLDAAEAAELVADVAASHGDSKAGRIAAKGLKVGLAVAELLAAIKEEPAPAAE